jgi:hypothetical protein
VINPDTQSRFLAPDPVGRRWAIAWPEWKLGDSWTRRGGTTTIRRNDFDVSPLLADNDRDVFSAGFGFGSERFGVDVGALLIKFKDRAILNPPVTSNYYGTYSETGLVLTAGIRFAM